MHPLTNHFSSPIEREYESWIVQGIEKYFKELEIHAAVWAVSPANEVNWPADEQVLVGNTIIGLQMKKVTYKPLKTSNNDFGRLYWSFQNPKAQYDLVVRFPEIFYCLPTFINRNYKGQALDHCLFWRPEKNSSNHKNAWYNNTKATRSHTPLREAPRWGLFIEDMLSGKVGREFSSNDDAIRYIESIRNYMRAPTQPEQRDPESEPIKSENEQESNGSGETSSDQDDDIDSREARDDGSIERSVYIIAVPKQS